MRQNLQFGMRNLVVVISAGAVILAAARWVAYKPSPSYRQGVAEAKAQIRAQHLTLYTYGNTDFDRSYDAETGLPRQSIGGDILADNLTADRAEGHNTYIRRWMAQGNVPPNSLKPYQHLIANPFHAATSVGFVPCVAGQIARLGEMRIEYTTATFRPHDLDHHFLVKRKDQRWSHTVFIHDARRFRAGLVADRRILALVYVVDGKGAFVGKRYQCIQLFDCATGISLNIDDRELPRGGPHRALADETAESDPS